MEEVIAKFLMRGTGMDHEIALVRAGHLLDDLNHEGYVIVHKDMTEEMLDRVRRLKN